MKQRIQSLQKWAITRLCQTAQKNPVMVSSYLKFSPWKEEMRLEMELLALTACLSSYAQTRTLPTTANNFSREHKLMGSAMSNPMRWYGILGVYFQSENHGDWVFQHCISYVTKLLRPLAVWRRKIETLDLIVPHKLLERSWYLFVCFFVCLGGVSLFYLLHIVQIF